jgi:hypothetical protein
VCFVIFSHCYSPVEFPLTIRVIPTLGNRGANKSFKNKTKFARQVRLLCKGCHAIIPREK